MNSVGSACLRCEFTFQSNEHPPKIHRQTILSPKWAATPEIISEPRAQFEKVFKRSFGIQDSKKPRHRKKASLHHTSQSFSQVRLDDALLKCISTLSPKCRDEELEDLIYFILDLYQFHDVALPISEVDVTQIVVDLRMILEDHATRNHGSKKSTKVNGNEHVFLVLDKNVQGLPWESIPILRGRSVSRIPSVDFLIDRLEYVELRDLVSNNRILLVRPLIRARATLSSILVVICAELRDLVSNNRILLVRPLIRARATLSSIPVVICAELKNASRIGLLE